MQTEILLDDPSLVEVINEIHSEPWPRFLSEDEAVKKYWRDLYGRFPQYQLLFKDADEYLGLANAFPIFWNGTTEGLPAGFDEAVRLITRASKPANALCALAIVVRKKHAGKGVSSAILRVIKEKAKEGGFRNLIIPVRPTLKSQYPLIPMGSYMQWKKEGWPFDPWLRVHVKAGGKILKEAIPSMVVKGTIAKWQDWTGLHFGESGEYVVKGALNPVMIDLQKDLGEYIEPNIWILHECE